MPETPKTQAESPQDTSEAVTWKEDQKQRQYYYDDAYGYQIFEDDETDDEIADDIVREEPGGNV